MPYCPECNVEYTVGVEKCSDCEVSLVEHLADEVMIEVPMEEGLCQVYCTNNLIEAEMIVSNLETAGIEAFIMDQQDRANTFLNSENLIKIFVDEKDYDSAVEYIEESNTNTTEVTPDT